MNATWDSVLKAISEGVIAFFNSDTPETIIKYFNSMSSEFVSVIRHIIETFVN